MIGEIKDKDIFYHFDKYFYNESQIIKVQTMPQAKEPDLKQFLSKHNNQKLLETTIKKFVLSNFSVYRIN